MPIFGTKLFYVPLHFNTLIIKHFIDSGAIFGAISRILFQKIESGSPESIKVLDNSHPTKSWFLMDSKSMFVEKHNFTFNWD